MVEVPIQLFTIGNLDYIARLNTNFASVKSAIELVDQLRQDAAQGGAVNAQDAVNNVPNACCNGRFFNNFCEGDENLLSQMPVINENHMTRRVVDADGWFIKPDFMDPSADQSTIIGVKNTTPGDSAEGSIQITPGNMYAYTGALTGTMFQRMDYYWPLEQIRNRNMSFWVNYTAPTTDEFYLEVDDGVTVTNTLAAPGGPSPDGTNTVFVSHLIDANASKLCVKIVLLKDARALGDPDAPLQIHECYARFGSGTVILPTAVSPQVMARDLINSQLMARAFSYGADLSGVKWPAAIGPGGSNEVSKDIFLDIPIMFESAVDLVSEVDWFVSTGADERSLDNADTIVLTTTGQLGWSNKTMSPSLMLDVERSVGPTDGSSGFVADQVDIKVCVIPDC